MTNLDLCTECSWNIKVKHLINLMNLQSDNGGGYHTQKFFDFCEAYIIYIQPSVLLKPEQNDFVEWLKYTLCIFVCALLNIPICQICYGIKLFLQHFIPQSFSNICAMWTSVHVNISMNRKQMCYISLYLAFWHLFTFSGSWAESLKKKLAK